MLVRDYCSCAQMFSSSSIFDVEHRLIELLNLFNSKTCQLVLGAGAVKLGKIKTISAKILAITCRCLQFIKTILPQIKSHFDQLQVGKRREEEGEPRRSVFDHLDLFGVFLEHLGDFLGQTIRTVDETLLGTHR